MEMNRASAEAGSASGSGAKAPLEALREAERRVRSLEVALRFYADERNWINRVEFKSFPGFHGAAVARRALDGPSVVATDGLATRAAKAAGSGGPA